MALAQSGGATFNFPGVTAGSYTVDYTDNNGCTGTASITVTERCSIGCQLLRYFRCFCNGGSDGAADVAASGGTAPYTGDGAQSGLTAGTYTFTVIDANGCTATCTSTINEPAALVASCSSNPVSCNGGTDGSSTVSASGGTAPYSGDGTTTGLAAGTYTYTVTDANGCTASCSTTVTEPAALVASCTSTDVSCNGGTDGSATVSASGGTAPYTGEGTTTGLSAGSYTYTVTDANGCTASCSSTVAEPSALVLNCTSTDVTCNNAADGTTTIAATGGTPPYSGTGTNTGLGPDGYSYTVTDANGCTASCFVVVNEPALLIATCSVTADVSCNGGSDGAASVSASGGTAPYSGEGAQTGLSAGAYTYTVTDANGCTATCTVTIAEPAALSASCSVTNDVSCNGGNDGAAS